MAEKQRTERRKRRKTAAKDRSAVDRPAGGQSAVDTAAVVQSGMDRAAVDHPGVDRAQTGRGASGKRLGGKSARAKILDSAFVVDVADLTELAQEMDAIGRSLLTVLAREEETETSDIDSSSRNREAGDRDRDKGDRSRVAARIGRDGEDRDRDSGDRSRDSLDRSREGGDRSRDDRFTSRDAGEVAWARRTLARLANDPRYEAVGPLFQLIEATINSGDLLEAQDLAAEVLNRVWRRSQEYDVGKNAFILRIRAREFKTLNDKEPLTVDRGAALARIMQSDKSELEAMARDPDRPKELVIKLDGEFDLIRLVKA